MKLFPHLFTLGGATAIVVLLLRPPVASADITIVSTFGGIGAHVTVKDDGLDPNPATDSDNPVPDETWRTSYSSSVSAQASKNGGAGLGTGNLTAQLSVNGDRLSYFASGTAQCSFTSSDTFTGTFFSDASAAGDATIRFTLTERSNFSMIGAISIFNPGSAQVRLFGNAVNKNFVVENRVNTPGAKSVNISDGGVLEPGSYTLELLVRPSTPQPFTSSTASSNLRFEIGSPPTEDIRWINTAGGGFGTIENWNPSKVPAGNSTAIFDPATAYTVNVGTAASDRLVIQNGDATFTNAAYSVTSIQFDPASVVLNNAKLTLASGQLNSGHALIGLSGASRLDVNTDAKWTSTGSIRVGGAGNGFLAIAAGGTVISAEARIGTGVGGGDVSIGGRSASWTTGNCAVGFDGAGTLTIGEGAVVTSGDSFIGRMAGSSGQVIVQDTDVNGAPAQWDLLAHTLVVGDEGVGELRILPGGFVSAEKLIIRLKSSGTGSMIIRGVADVSEPLSAAILLFGDAVVDGSLRIEQGGVSSQFLNDFVIGFAFDGQVTATGFDPGSGIRSRVQDVRDLTVGANAKGTLTVEKGALANSKNGFIATSLASQGDAIVDGTGNGKASTWTLDGDLTVAQSGTGTLRITNGGVVTAGVTIIGEEAGSIGTVSVSGGSSLGRSLFTVADTMNVGFRGRGNLTVDAGGRVAVSGFLGINGESEIIVGGKDPATNVGSVIDVDGNVFLEASAASTCRMAITEDGTVSCHNATIGAVPGFCTVDLGTTGVAGAPARFNMTGDLTVGETGNTLLFLRNGAIITVGGTLLVGPRGAIGGIGTLSAEVRIVNGGLIQSGLSPGLLTFNGDFEQTGTGVVEIEIAGTTPGTTHDQLVINGDVSLGGKLLLKFIRGFAPRQGDQFELLVIAGATTGVFAEVEVEGLKPGFQFTAESNGTGQIVLTALNDGVPLPARGTFRGLLSGDPAGHAAAGFFKIHTTPRGGFSARFVLGGRTVTLGGKFNSGGTFSKTILRKSGSPLTVNLELAVIDGARGITGTITDGAQSIDLSADRANVFSAKNNPAPQAGKYTVLLPFDPAAIDAPQADGIGTVTIRKSGAVRFAGALADGKRLSQGTVLSKSGEWPLYVLLYKKRGSLFGTLQFQDKAGSDFDGTLHWSRPQTLGNRIQTSGFLTALPAIGSRYAAPPARPALLDLPNGATATLSDADLTPALTKGLTLNSRNKFAVSDAGADQLSFSATTARGLLSARFIHPTTGLEITVQGVLFQKQNLGSGFFLRQGRIGSLSIQANP